MHTFVEMGFLSTLKSFCCFLFLFPDFWNLHTCLRFVVYRFVFFVSPIFSHRNFSHRDLEIAQVELQVFFDVLQLNDELPLARRKQVVSKATSPFAAERVPPYYAAVWQSFHFAERCRDCMLHGGLKVGLKVRPQSLEPETAAAADAVVAVAVAVADAAVSV